MKVSIEGFNQEYAMSLKKEVEQKGKLVTKKIDCTDLVILRWFVDFYPKMRKMTVDGVEYAWLTHNKLKEDLPIIDISRKAFIDRMQKLVDLGVLKYQLVKEGGTFSLYGFGENYEGLVASSKTQHLTSTVYGQTDTGCTVNPTRGGSSTDHGVYGQPTNKDKTIIDKTIIDKTINNINEHFEMLWSEYPKKKGKSSIKQSTKAKLYEAGDDVFRAIENYKEEIAKDKIADQYIMYGSTFFNDRWEDYVNIEEVSVYGRIEGITYL